MTDKELSRLKRSELLELLIAQDKELEDLRSRISDLEAKLENREITIQEAGSIAEAAVRLNGLFETAQKVADQYLMNVRRLSDSQSTEQSL